MKTIVTIAVALGILVDDHSFISLGTAIVVVAATWRASSKLQHVLDRISETERRVDALERKKKENEK